MVSYSVVVWGPPDNITRIPIFINVLIAIGFYLFFCVYDFIGDRTLMYYVLFDRKQNDLCRKKVMLVNGEEEYWGEELYRNTVYDVRSLRYMIHYKGDDKEDFIRFILTEEKKELLDNWKKLTNEQRFFYEIVYYRKSKILKEICPVEGIEYPAGIVEILDKFNRMYP